MYLFIYTMEIITPDLLDSQGYRENKMRFKNLLNSCCMYIDVTFVILPPVHVNF